MDYMVTVHRGSSVYDLARPTVLHRQICIKNVLFRQTDA